MHNTFNWCVKQFNLNCSKPYRLLSGNLKVIEWQFAANLNNATGNPNSIVISNFNTLNAKNNKIYIYIGVLHRFRYCKATHTHI